MSSQLYPILTAPQLRGHVQASLSPPKKLAGWVKTLGRRVTPGRMRYLLHNYPQPGFGSAAVDVNLSHFTPTVERPENSPWWKYMNGRQRNAMFSCFAWFRIKCSTDGRAGSCALSASCWQSQHPQPHSSSSYHTISALRIMVKWGKKKEKNKIKKAWNARRALGFDSTKALRMCLI